MIIGIDEVGDFSHTSTKYNYFVATLIDQNGNKYSAKKKVFEEWESKIPAEFKTKDGEVKGQLLTEKQLESFYEIVINPFPAIVCAVVRIRPADISKEYIDKVRDHIVGEIDKMITQFSEIGDTPIFRDYQKIRRWYKNRNYNNILKILCTERILSLAFRFSVGRSQLTYLIDKGDITNLKNVKFLIDKDFIRAPNTERMHNEMFRQYFSSNANHHHVPIMTGVWKDEDHPIWKVYKKIDSIHIGITNAFRDKVFFVDSHNHWEVRIADIVGTILHRYQNQNRCKTLGARFMADQFPSKTENFVHILMSDY